MSALTPKDPTFRVGAEADVIDLVCGDCGNEHSAVRLTAELGRCAWCITARARELRQRFHDRYRSAERWF